MFRTTVLVVALLGLAGGMLLGCTPKYPNCDKDDHCKEGEYCVNNLCQQCRDSGDCPEGQECTDGACREIIGYCKQSADCAEGQVCRDNRCGPCMRAEECGDNQVCVDGQCKKAECRSHDDCPAGLDCINYACVPTTQKTELGEGECELQTIYFDFDSSELSAEMRNTLERNYNCLTKRGGSVSLVGHCDPRGTTEYNMALGERRAKVVKRMLTTLGMDAKVLKTSSKGEEEATGGDEGGWARDRKVEFR